MSELDELRERVSALEARLEMQATLRAAGDQDLADLTQRTRAIHHLVQALAITQAEHTQALDRHTRMHTTTHEKLNVIIELIAGLGEGEGK